MWEEPWHMRKVAEMMCGATWVSGGGVKLQRGWQSRNGWWFDFWGRKCITKLVGTFRSVWWEV